MIDETLALFDAQCLPDSQAIFVATMFICEAGHVIKGSSRRWAGGCPVQIDTGVPKLCCDRPYRLLSDYPIVEAAWRLGGAGAVRVIWREQ